MPLQYQHVPIALTGIDTKTDDRNVISGKLILGENCWMTKSGKIQSRYGYVLGSQGAAAHVVGGLINGVPAAIRPLFIDKLTTPASSVAARIPLVSVQTGTDITLNPTYPTGIFASAGTAGYVLAGMFSGTNYRVSVIDTVNMVEVTGTVANNGTIYSARVTAEGNSAAIAVGVGSNMKLYTAPNMAAVNQITVTPVAGISSNIYDIAYSGTNIGITWIDAGNVYFAYWNGATWSATTTVAAFAGTAIGINKSAVVDQWKITTALGTSIKCYHINSTGGLISTTSYTGSGYTDADAIVVAPSASTNIFAVQGRNIVAGTTRGFGVFLQNGSVGNFEPCVKIGAKISDGNLTLVNASIKNYGAATAAVQALSGTSSYSVYSFATNTTATYGIEYAFSYASGQAVVVDNGDFGALVLNKPSFLTGGVFFGQRVTDYIKSMASTAYTVVNSAYRLGSELATWQEYNGSAYTNVFGAVRQISSTAIAPQEIPISFPFPPAMPVLASAAGSMPVGTYQVVLVYEAFDARGRAIRSAPSLPESITLAGVGSINVTVNTSYYSIYSEFKGQVAVYITQANGTIFYRAGTVNGSPGSLLTISANPDTSEQVLYTTGGVLDAGNPGISAGIFTARDRLWSISAENRNVVFFSEITSPGQVPSFNEILYLNVPDPGGRLIAIAEMDEKILLFKESAVYFTYGNGPDNLGTGEYPSPQLLSQSLGCKYARSVVLTDNGVMFMSGEGIWLVDRGLSLKYIGAPVEAYNALTITGTINLVDRHQVWFFSVDGTTLSYDEYHQQWYAFTGQRANVVILQQNGTPSFITTNGLYYVESSSAVDDNGSRFTMKLKSGWTSLTGIQGFQRFRRMQWSGSAANTMTLKLRYDFSTTVAETFTVTTAAVGTTPYQWEVKPAQQKCEAIQFELESEALTAALSLSTFSIEAGAKQGTNRLPIAKRVQGV